MAARSLQQILRRFNLSEKATKADLRKAYLQQAKELHPDIAGPETEERFKQINDEYERGMKLLREAEMDAKRHGGFTGQHPGFTPGTGGVNPREYTGYSHVRSDGRGGYYYTTSETGTNQGYSASWQEAQRELTPAQRLRNVVLYAGVIFCASVLLLRWQRDSRERRSKFEQASIKTREEAEQEVRESRETTKAAGAAVAKRKDSESHRQDGERVSSYYKNRSKVASVRQYDDSTYVSSTEELKSRRKVGQEEGFGASVKAVTRLARGESPAEAPAEAVSSNNK